MLNEAVRELSFPFLGSLESGQEKVSLPEEILEPYQSMLDVYQDFCNMVQKNSNRKELPLKVQRHFYQFFSQLFE